MAGYGLIPVRNPYGGNLSLNSFSAWTIAAAYTTKLFTGDMVALHSDGTLVIGSATLLPIGVFGGVEYRTSTGEVVFKRYWDAPTSATSIKAYVYDDPFNIMRVQADQVGTALLSTDVGVNFDLTTTAGSTVTGQSKIELDSSVTGVTTTANVLLLGSAEVDGSFTAAGTTMNVEVMWTEHRLRPGPIVGI